MILFREWWSQDRWNDKFYNLCIIQVMEFVPGDRTLVFWVNFAPECQHTKDALYSPYPHKVGRVTFLHAVVFLPKDHRALDALPDALTGTLAHRPKQNAQCRLVHLR